MYIHKFKQICVIPVRYTEEDGWQYLMVKSTNKGTWIFPKGSIRKREKQRDAVQRELFEEAGGYSEGRLFDPVGAFTFVKDKKPVGVIVYALFPVYTSDTYPEEDIRERKWFSYKEAKRALKRKAMKKILKQLNKRIRQRKKPAKGTGGYKLPKTL